MFTGGQEEAGQIIELLPTKNQQFQNAFKQLNQGQANQYFTHTSE